MVILFNNLIDSMSEIEKLKEISFFIGLIISLIGLFIKLGTAKRLKDNVLLLRMELVGVLIISLSFMVAYFIHEYDKIYWLFIVSIILLIVVQIFFKKKPSRKPWNEGFNLFLFILVEISLITIFSNILQELNFLRDKYYIGAVIILFILAAITILPIISLILTTLFGLLGKLYDFEYKVIFTSDYPHCNGQKKIVDYKKHKDQYILKYESYEGDKLVKSALLVKSEYIKSIELTASNL